MIQAERFDLYLLESWLPEVDGFELCREMRSVDPQTPIVFFSGAGYANDRKMGIEAGADAYLVKPDLEALVGSLKQFVTTAKGVLA
jgi:DNA-binding response OmpR family regulator